MGVIMKIHNSLVLQMWNWLSIAGFVSTKMFSFNHGKLKYFLLIKNGFYFNIFNNSLFL